MLGAAIASISYIGFDAISTLAEDTINPETDISIATVLVCVIQTVFCVVTVYLAALVWPDFNSYPESETVILDIGRRAGGPWMMGFLTFILLVAGLASALTGQAGASRLLLGMGRDGVISRRVFAHVDARYSTPSRSVYLMGAFALVGIAGDAFSTRGGIAELRCVRRIHPGEPERDLAFLSAFAAAQRHGGIDESDLSANRRAGVFLCVAESKC